MKQYTTQKLFFKKYPYKIVLTRTGAVTSISKIWNDGWTPFETVSWLKENKIPYRVWSTLEYPNGRKVFRKIAKSLITATIQIFLENSNDFDLCKERFKDNLDSVTKPYNDLCLKYLKDNANVFVRRTLLSKKFRYVITFKKWDPKFSDIDLWIKENLLPNERIKWSSDRYSYYPKLYLCDDADYFLVKLAWSEKLDDITVYTTFDEFEETINI